MNILRELDKSINSIAPEILNKIIDPVLLEKIDKIKIPKNDPFGINKQTLKFASFFLNFFYKSWNRVEVFGIDNVPSTGAAILVPNHGGMLPVDAAHIATSLIVESKQPRLVRTLVERFLPTLPFVYTFMTRVGQTVGTYENAELILNEGELLQVFPEGAAGATKPYYKYYELDDFNVGFMELAIRKKVPIIPIGVIGSHEQALILFDFKPLAKLLKMPNFPVTPFWPLFGPLGTLPLPSKYRIIFGRPMDFSQYDEETINDPEMLKQLVEKVKSEVKNLINIGLDMRPMPFL
ncbi:MAG: acyltransferase family protein [Candidatus Sericytochromatia bacterium]|nr:acyltransferase family protein [Candidatus Sericytochromatia bacterium]